ncbi:MAG: hypothetical protein PHH59_12895 [Methylovulum sp.]|uniref:hypothetical protein n=1 Tax=Methylovulum sp. TaxID=1916980 RepID=UPI002607A418|nr:hypothetical protein [Methylovulum sp.]MDD2724905.1 hypothetical protein [Methylovulum sp.]MDD5124693.1 hypothetical protein [Methylovulum sp.]
MQLTTSQLQSKHKALVEALKRGEKVEITYHGRILGVVHPATPASIDTKAQAAAMADFFGMHRDAPIDTVEDELRGIRSNRRGLRDL